MPYAPGALQDDNSFAQVNSILLKTTKFKIPPAHTRPYIKGEVVTLTWFKSTGILLCNWDWSSYIDLGPQYPSIQLYVSRPQLPAKKVNWAGGKLMSVFLSNGLVGPRDVTADFSACWGNMPPGDWFLACYYIVSYDDPTGATYTMGPDQHLVTVNN